MAGVSRQPDGESGGQGTGDAVADDEEDEVLFVPPRLNGLHLTVTWPIRCPVACMIGNCRTKIKSENRYSVVHDLLKHMKAIHGVVVSGKSNWCGLCHTAIGRCPANHGCFKGKDDLMLVLTDEGCDFKCDQCSKTFPNYRGLSNHKVSHKRNLIQHDYNRKNNLPVVGVARRAGGTGAGSTGARAKVVGTTSKTTVSSENSMNISKRSSTVFDTSRIRRFGGNKENSGSTETKAKVVKSGTGKGDSSTSGRSSARSSLSVKSTVENNKCGSEIDKFIQDTKRFISSRENPIVEKVDSDVNESIIITDEIINEFVEAVTGSGISDPALSSTKISSPDNSGAVFSDNDDTLGPLSPEAVGVSHHSSQVPAHSSSAGVRTIDGQISPARDNDANLSVHDGGNSSDVSDLSYTDLLGGGCKFLTSTQVPKADNCLPNSQNFNPVGVFRVNDGLSGVLPYTNDFNPVNVPEPPIQAGGTESIFNESVVFNSFPYAADPPRQWGLFARGGG